MNRNEFIKSAKQRMNNDSPHYFNWSIGKWESYLLDEIVIVKDARTAVESKLACEYLLNMYSGPLEDSILEAMREKHYVDELREIIRLHFSCEKEKRIMLKNE